jgi:hypothetical protein
MEVGFSHLCGCLTSVKAEFRITQTVQLSLYFKLYSLSLKFNLISYIWSLAFCVREKIDHVWIVSKPI